MRGRDRTQACFRKVECPNCGGLLEECQAENRNNTVFVLTRVNPYLLCYNGYSNVFVIKISRNREELEALIENINNSWEEIRKKYLEDFKILRDQIESLLRVHKSDVYHQWINPLSVVASELAHSWGYFRDNGAILANSNEGFGSMVDKSVYYHLEPVYMPTFSNTACDEYYLEISEVECDL